MRLGAAHLGGGRSAFCLWAPRAEAVELVLTSALTGDQPDGRTNRAAIRTVETAGPDDRGYHTAVADRAPPGTRYRWRVTAAGTTRDLADPASRWQPDGVTGPSAVVDDKFVWTDGSWHGLPLSDLVIYELHVGAFTAAGTFAAVTDHLDELVMLGVTAIELMPVGQFPGARNWGYDGVFPFAAQSTYGGPDGLRRLVDAAHARGIAVLVDVVYNHFGPEGAVQPALAPYHTDRYTTPWGPAMNFDGPGSDEVRRYVIENALWWVDGCHADGLRLDAVHAIYDVSARDVLTEIAEAVHAVGERANRRVHVIAESDRNDPRLVRPAAVGGCGLDAAWSDDFHHAVHAALTGERDGYYADFGDATHLATALTDGYVLAGQRSAYRGHRHGAPPVGVPGRRFVVFVQNHDQVGNRARGRRLVTLVGREAAKVAAACVLLSPYVPLLFMGEEYGEPAPFAYFVDHGDSDLLEAVRDGRVENFAAFDWSEPPPDPGAPATFEASRLDHSLKETSPHREMFAYYRRLLALRHELPALARLNRDRLEATADGPVVAWRRWHHPLAASDRQPHRTSTGGRHDHVMVAANLSDREATTVVALPAGRWERLVDSRDQRWAGPGGHSPPTLTTAAHRPLRRPAGTRGEPLPLTVPARTALVYRRQDGG